MTPDKIAEAVYEIGQAAATESEARSAGSVLGNMLATQSLALGAAGKQLNCSSATEIEQILLRLAAGRILHHAIVAGAALNVWRRRMGES